MMERPVSAHGGVAGVELGLSAVAAKTTRMPMILIDANKAAHPIVFANDSFVTMTGFTQNEVLGRALGSILDKISDPVTSSTMQRALVQGSEGAWELNCRRVDGTKFPTSVFLSPVRDKANVLRQHSLSFIPLSSRFPQHGNEIQALFKHTPGFIATVEGPDHRFTFANASYMKFVGRENLEGLTVAEALPEIADQGFIDILDEVFRTGEPYRGTAVQFEIQDPVTGNSVRRFADFVYQPVRDSHGDVVGLFCEGYDVTVQCEAADQLAVLQAELIHTSRVNAMGTMAITLAHELNQPLTAIVNFTAGSLRLVERSGRDDKPLVRALCAIDEASQRASEIIRTLRELTKRREPSRTSFDVKPAVKECIRLVCAAAPPEVEIDELVPEDLTIAGDRIQIQQVTINLLRNAVDAVTASGRWKITVSAVARDDDIMVSVADTGPGVSLKAAEDIFSWTHSAKEGGMGLGLSICRTIMEGHRGRI